MRTLIYALFAWLLALSLLTAVQFDQMARSRASARSDAAAIWRSVVCSIEGQELKNPRTTPAQRTALVKFWTALLVEQVHTKPCGP